MAGFHNANFEDLSHLLKVFDQVFKAHSIILSTRSVYFQNALSNPGFFFYF